MIFNGFCHFSLFPVHTIVRVFTGVPVQRASARMKRGHLLKRKRRRCKCQRRRYDQIANLKNSRNQTGSLSFFLLNLSRKVYPMEVTAVRYYGLQTSGYAVCPSCNRAMEREYQNCCEHCGQKLGWELFGRGKVACQRIQPYHDKIHPAPKQEEQVLSYSSS